MSETLRALAEAARDAERELNALALFRNSAWRQRKRELAEATARMHAALTPEVVLSLLQPHHD